MVDEGDECRLYRVGGDTVVPEFTSQANLVQPVGSWEAGDLHGHQLHGVEVQQVSGCGIQVGALAPGLQWLEPVGDMVAAEEVVCNNANEIAIDVILEASVLHKKVASQQIAG